jgi:hypothetical protein
VIPPVIPDAANAAVRNPYSLTVQYVLNVLSARPAVMDSGLAAYAAPRNDDYIRVTFTCSSAARPPRTSLAQRAMAAGRSAGSETFSA